MAAFLADRFGPRVDSFRTPVFLNIISNEMLSHGFYFMTVLKSIAFKSWRLIVLRFTCLIFKQGFP